MANIVQDALALKQLTVENTEHTAGRVGRNAYFSSLSDVKLGGWFNAAKAQLHFGAAGTGEITGFASVFNAELYLPNKTMAGGSYTVLETNLQVQTSTVTHGNPAYPSSFIRFNLAGAAKTTWEDAGDACLFDITGFDGGANSVIDLTGAPGGGVDGSIRIIINGADWFIPIYDGS